MVWNYPKFIITTLCLALITSGCGFDNGLTEAKPSSSSSITVRPIKEKEPVSFASRQQENHDPGEASSSNQQESADSDAVTSQKVPIKPLPIFTKEAYTLMGLSIGEKREDVVRWFGQPPHIYEPTAELVEQVHEYDGYLIGYSVDGKVKWIKVTGEYINPLLPNIHVGSTKDEVLDTFGKPDYSNDYQVQYIHSGDSVTLKMDIDSTTSIVQSISLYKNDR
jgi:hypothetical protein